ncbi:DUF86 [Desulfonema limicola]|uniref:DUF86 n=1 Tax=Desulfonema limicola TaxID=45656 RepID=A0A975BCX2_9BACT|nr:DUF86 [Desulfonema limicola]
MHLDYLRHILDETVFLLKESKGISEDEFLEDEKLKRAFVRSFEIIGEASKNIPDDEKKKYRSIDWKAMARMRDRLIHHYFGVDYHIVWDTVQENIPSLQKEIEKIIASNASE